MLNLLRGFFALSEACEPKKRHGLGFVREDEANFIDMGAEFKDGTFTNYLDALTISYGHKTIVTLGQAFSRIVELANDNISSSVGVNEVFPVRLEAYHSGKVRFHFHCPPGQESLFAAKWQHWFPKLKDLCSLDPGGKPILEVDRSKVDTASREKIVDFCHQTLELNLSSYEDPLWFAICQTVPELNLPRAAFYFIGAFILSSAVRYKPERLLDISNPDPETGWGYAILKCRGALFSSFVT